MYVEYQSAEEIQRFYIAFVIRDYKILKYIHYINEHYKDESQNTKEIKTGEAFDNIYYIKNAVKFYLQNKFYEKRYSNSSVILSDIDEEYIDYSIITACFGKYNTIYLKNDQDSNEYLESWIRQNILYFICDRNTFIRLKHRYISWNNFL
ncbi:hypothetical protein COBT_000127 [Conglomerata obtusa]